MHRGPLDQDLSHPTPLGGDPRRTRVENARETALDYVELIAELVASEGEARVTALARRLGVSHVTVNRTLKRLDRDGLVTVEPYRPVRLTEAGVRLSEQSRRRHVVVLAFLRSLGVPPVVARADAEGIEHHVSAETLAAFERHLARQDPPEDG
ncbi:MAG: manganese-binding transcriptional regulator MntR [Armatimonadetes bacterium]|nr:manganese-binding transcriptional regulator MntR [Armatimonadota bacterium]